MTDIARRSFLKVLSAFPLAGKALEQSIAVDAHGGLSPVPPMPAEGAVAGSEGLVTYRDFGKWWDEIGKHGVENEANVVQGFDADILTMQIALQAKVRMQRRRHFQRLKNKKRNWFQRRIAQYGALQDFIE